MMTLTILIGFVFLGMGWVTKTFPPKSINAIYGYRTSTAKRNADTWEEANTMSARLMMLLGAMTVCIGCLATQMFESSETFDFWLMLSCLFTIIFLLFYLTEQHLGKTFDTAGNRN